VTTLPPCSAGCARPWPRVLPVPNGPRSVLTSSTRLCRFDSGKGLSTPNGWRSHGPATHSPSTAARVQGARVPLIIVLARPGVRLVFLVQSCFLIQPMAEVTSDRAREMKLVYRLTQGRVRD